MSIPIAEKGQMSERCFFLCQTTFVPWKYSLDHPPYPDICQHRIGKERDHIEHHHARKVSRNKTQFHQRHIWQDHADVHEACDIEDIACLARPVEHASQDRADSKADIGDDQPPESFGGVFHHLGVRIEEGRDVLPVQDPDQCNRDHDRDHEDHRGNHDVLDLTVLLLAEVVPDDNACPLPECEDGDEERPHHPHCEPVTAKLVGSDDVQDEEQAHVTHIAHE